MAIKNSRVAVNDSGRGSKAREERTRVYAVPTPRAQTTRQSTPIAQRKSTPRVSTQEAYPSREKMRSVKKK